MSHYLPGAVDLGWGNPFKTNRYSRRRCLERYEDHIIRTPSLFRTVRELEGKELGCWCKPSLCHGDVLIKLFKEWQHTNQHTSRSDHEPCPLLIHCGNNEVSDDIQASEFSSSLLDLSDMSETGSVSSSRGIIGSIPVVQRSSVNIERSLLLDPLSAEGTVTSIGSLNSTIVPETPTLLSQLNISADLETSIRSAGSLPLTENSPAIIDGIMTPNISNDSIFEYREAHHSDTPYVTSTENILETDNTSFPIKDIIANNAKHEKYGRNRPQTQVFSQGKTYTYNKLEVPSPNKCNNKSMMSSKKPDSFLFSKTRPCVSNLDPKDITSWEFLGRPLHRRF